MALTQQQIDLGYWSYHPWDDRIPECITYPDEYQDGEILNLNITQLNLSSYKQKKLVETWCKLLPELDKVRYVWFRSRVNQAMFDAACQVRNLKGLHIKWSGIKDLMTITHAENLAFFHLGSSPSVGSIDMLATMKSLVVLKIENLKKISDLEPISDLVQLEGLAVEGGIWSRQVVDSLQPLQTLKSLDFLSLINLISNDGTLKPLYELKTLTHLYIAYYWKKSELRQLRDILPKLVDSSLFDDDLIEKFGKK